MVSENPASAIQVSTLLFAPGARPTVDSLRRLSEITGAFSISHSPAPRAPHAQPEWVELLCDGLTFDVSGLEPAPVVPGAPAPHRVGLPATLAPEQLESLDFAPGAHLAGAENLLPVVRVAAAILAEMAELPGIQAIGWSPARNLANPAWFAQAVGAWLAGGPFPALALTALARGDRTVTSCGLAFFIGQEFRLDTGGGPPGERHARAAVRLTDWLVAHGRLDRPREIILPGAGALWLDPDHRGTIVARCL